MLDLKGENAPPNLLRYVTDYKEELFLSKVGTLREKSFEVSNIGELGGWGGGSLGPRIERMVFSQSANVTGSAVEVSAVTGGDGCLVLSLTWQKDVVEEELVSGLIDSTRRMLNDMVMQ